MLNGEIKSHASICIDTDMCSHVLYIRYIGLCLRPYELFTCYQEEIFLLLSGRGLGMQMGASTLLAASAWKGGKPSLTA